MLIPYRVDVPMYRWPFANWAIILVTVVVSIVLMPALFHASDVSTLFGEETWQSSLIHKMVLTRECLTGLVGWLFLHGGWLHLFGNMLFLWVFGNAVCAKIGNIWFPIVYLLLGVLAGATHLAFENTPAIGASGAINGIVGMFLIWYPLNSVSCMFWILLFVPRFFSISSIWMILLWLAFDILGVALGAGGVAYWAHLGGLAGGVILAVLLLKVGLVSMDRGERSLLDILGIPDTPRPRVATSRRRAPEPVREVPSAYVAPPQKPIPLADDPPAPPPEPRVFMARCSCGKALRIPAERMGTRGKCPACGNVFRIPDRGTA